jgi:hypothetical protein
MLFQYPGLMMMSLAGAGAAEILTDPADWLRGTSAGLSAAGRAGYRFSPPRYFVQSQNTVQLATPIRRVS